MRLLQNRGGKMWQALVCSMLSAVLMVPMAAEAASGKTAPSKKQRVVASKAAERRKVVTTRKVKSGKVAVKSASTKPSSTKRLSREEARKVQRLALRAKGKVPVSSKASNKVSSITSTGFASAVLST